MALETTVLITLLGNVAVLCSDYVLDDPIDGSVVSIAACLPDFLKKNTSLENRLEKHCAAMNERLDKTGHGEKAEQLAAVAEDILVAAQNAGLKNVLKEAGLNGQAIWVAIAKQETVKNKLSAKNADAPIANLIPDLIIGLLDAWLNDPKTLDGFKKFHLEIDLDTNRVVHGLAKKVEDLSDKLSEFNQAHPTNQVSITDEQIAGLLEAFEAAHEQKERWLDLLIEKAGILKDLQIRLTGLSNADPKVAALRKEAEEKIQNGHLDEAGKLLEEAENLDAEAIEVQKQQMEELQGNIGQRQESQALSAFSRGGLAEAQLKYTDAFQHYFRAYELAPDAQEYLHKATDFANRAGEYAIGEELAQIALNKAAELHGKESTQYAMWLNNLAALYRAQGDYEAAEPLYQRALAISEKALGPDHPNVSTTLNNLALLYKVQGKYEEAEPLYQRDLAISEKALGADHPDVAITLNNLANLYRSQGKFEEAEPLYQRAVMIGEKTLGPNHPGVAITLNNLAGLYKTQAKYEEAEPLLKRALAMGEKALGPDHPSVAIRLNNLANLYIAQGKHEKAEPLFKRDLSISEKALGPDHPDVATTLNNLAGLYESQGKYNEAEALYHRALTIREKVLESDHPDVAGTLNNLAMLYKKQGKYKKAEPPYKRALAISEKKLGSDHPDVATMLNNLAALYMAQGKYEEAEALYQRDLAISEKALEPDHPDVASTLNNLGGLYQAQGRYVEAESHYKRAIEILEKAFPDGHPNLDTARNNYATMLAEKS